MKRTLAAVLAGGLMVTLVPVVAMAAPTQQGDSRPITVSLPPEPTVISPGTSATIRMRVINSGSAPVSVTISGRALNFGDNGELQVGSKPDPAWQGLVDFPAGPVTIPAQAYTNAPITVRLPAQIDPDLYFIGFLVTPVESGAGNLKVVNQIGWYITVDVPGPRVRKLAGDIAVRSFAIAGLEFPSFVLGTKAEGTLHVRNVGRAAVRFWGETDTTSSPGSSVPHQDRIEKSLVPVGKSRSFAISGEPNWPIGFVTMKVRVIYPGVDETSTKELVFSKRILVVDPLFLAVLVLLIASVMAWLWHRHRRKRRSLAARKRKPRPPTPVAAKSLSSAKRR